MTVPSVLAFKRVYQRSAAFLRARHRRRVRLAPLAPSDDDIRAIRSQQVSDSLRRRLRDVHDDLNPQRLPCVRHGEARVPAARAHEQVHAVAFDRERTRPTDPAKFKRPARLRRFEFEVDVASDDAREGVGLYERSAHVEFRHGDALHVRFRRR